MTHSPGPPRDAAARPRPAARRLLRTLALAFAALAVVAAPVRDARGAAARTPENRPAVTSQAGPVVPVDAPGVLALARRPGARGTIVNVWATWCPPCRDEFPALLSVAQAAKARGLRVVLVSADFDDQLAAVRSFLAAHGVTDTSYLKTGDDMKFINTMNPRWSGALPATFVYAADGTLAQFWEGRADSARFQKAVDQVLNPAREEKSR